MRIVSMNGMVDLPYDLAFLEIVCSEEHGAWVIYAADSVDSKECLVMADYPTKEAAVQDMIYCRSAWQKRYSWFQFGGDRATLRDKGGR